MELGEILARTGARSTSFEQRTSPVYGAITPSDIAAALATVKRKPAADLVQAKYIDHDPSKFPASVLINEYIKTCTHRLKRPDTLKKISVAAIAFYIKEPRCRRCRGHAQEWDKEELKFISCQACGGLGGRQASIREIARLSGMSRSKLKDKHTRCFWEMHQILSIWEDVAAGQIKRALRK